MEVSKVFSCSLIIIVVTVIYVWIIWGGYLLAYTPHTDIHSLDLDDAEPAFPIFKKHVRVSVDLLSSLDHIVDVDLTLQCKMDFK